MHRLAAANVAAASNEGAASGGNAPAAVRNGSEPARTMLHGAATQNLNQLTN
jgi:hypothetical protein